MRSFRGTANSAQRMSPGLAALAWTKHVKKSTNSPLSPRKFHEIYRGVNFKSISEKVVTWEVTTNCQPLTSIWRGTVTPPFLTGDMAIPSISQDCTPFPIWNLAIHGRSYIKTNEFPWDFWTFLEVFLKQLPVRTFWGRANSSKIYLYFRIFEIDLISLFCGAETFGKHQMFHTWKIQRCFTPNKIQKKKYTWKIPRSQKSKCLTLGRSKNT